MKRKEAGFLFRRLSACGDALYRARRERLRSERHAARGVETVVKPNEKMKRIGNTSKEKTRGMRQPDRFTLHEASTGTKTIRYRLRLNAT